MNSAIIQGFPPSPPIPIPCYLALPFSRLLYPCLHSTSLRSPQPNPPPRLHELLYTCHHAMPVNAMPCHAHSLLYSPPAPGPARWLERDPSPRERERAGERWWWLEIKETLWLYALQVGFIYYYSVAVPHTCMNIHM